MEHDTYASPAPAPRTLTVLGLLALTALTFSYLGSYAVMNALVAADVIPAWPTNRDPRPRWLLIGFCVLMLAFIVVGELCRQVSKRELRKIEEMTDAEDGAS